MMRRNMINHKISTVRVPNSDVLVFDFNFTVSKSRINCFERPLERKSSEKYLKSIGPKGRVLVKGLIKPVGILSVTIKRYQVSVLKAPLFEWKALLPTIKRALLETLPESKREGFVIEGFPKN